MGKYQGKMYEGRLFHKIWYRILVSIGPFIYLVFLILPWWGLWEFDSPEEFISLAWLFSREEIAQVGQNLRSDSEEIPQQPYAFLGSQNIEELRQGQDILVAKQNEVLYERLRQFYAASLFRKLERSMQTREIPNADWVALYLELLLDQKNRQISSGQGAKEINTITEPWADYEKARKQMQQIVRANGWSSPNLAPYLGIALSDLELFIRADQARIEEVRNSYLYANWSFNGQIDLADLLFNYSYLKLLRGVLQHAVNIRETVILSEKEQFYLLGFLWRAVSAYSLNGIVQGAGVRQEFSALLQRISVSWRQGFSEGLSISYVLDVLNILKSEELGLKELGYPIAIQLFQLMDSEGRLPDIYGVEGGRIPYYRSWSALENTLQRPHSTTVVPGFWLWTAGTASTFYEAGKPIEMTVENFPASQGNQLLLLRGIYFTPQAVIVDGAAASSIKQIPVPQLGQQASWYYNFGNKLLAIEIPVSSQDQTKLFIR